jgi:uncharacterized membrane protein YtjA (UPF0391 family)
VANSCYGVQSDKKLKPIILWEVTVLYWAIVFLIIALAAGILGFGVVAGTAASIAKVLFVVFLIIFLVSLISGTRRPRMM